MKANKDQLARAIKAPAQTRFFLFHGPDEAGSQALAVQVGAGAERVDLTGAMLKEDPARLADEAAAISLFGGLRYVVVRPAGDECVTAVEALISVPITGNPVVLVAGVLKPASKLLKLAMAERSAIAFGCFPPNDRDAPRLVTEIAREHGLTLRPELASRLFDAAGGNRAIVAQELAKLSAYLDASPTRPQTLEIETVDAIGAGGEEGDLNQLVEAVSSGDGAVLRHELDRLGGVGIDGIALLRPLLRRMTLLARLRAEVDGGSSLAAVMASSGRGIFWKDRDNVARQVRKWPAGSIVKAIARLAEAERQVKSPGALGPVAVSEELFAICRQAARLR